jgi:hypothetical protein
MAAMPSKDPTLDAIMDGLDDDTAAPPIPGIAPMGAAGGDMKFQDASNLASSQPSGMIASSAPAQQTAPQQAASNWGSSKPEGSPGVTDQLIDNSNAPIYSLAYYKVFFDVDTGDVSTRLLKAMQPLNTKFADEVKPNPDLYGPFWVCTTLVFAMAAAGNFANYLSSSSTAPWSYDFNKVTLAACVVYGYGFMIPMLVNFMAMYYTQGVGFVSLVCLYGYSLTAFVAAAFLAPAERANFAPGFLSALLGLALLRRCWDSSRRGDQGDDVELGPADATSQFSMLIILKGVLGCTPLASLVWREVLVGEKESSANLIPCTNFCSRRSSELKKSG